MGLKVSRMMDRNELADFKKLPLVPDDFRLPEPPENREQTNKFWIVALGVCILILLPFLIYNLSYSDTRRLVHGVDDCGNVCGYNNSKIDGIACSGKDYLDKPFSYLNEEAVDKVGTVKECVKKCPVFTRAFYCNSYVPSHTERVSEVVHEIKEALHTLQHDWHYFILSVLITIVLSVSALCLYKVATAIAVWTVLVLSIIGMLLLTSYMWLVVAFIPDSIAIVTVAILLTIFSFGMIVLTIVLFKRIQMVILLFKEATKAICAMPGLLLISIISAWTQVVVFILCFTTSILMVSSGTLIKLSDDKYEYQLNIAMIFAIGFNIFVGIWVLQCFSGCQYMVVAGSVSRWFFTRNKNQLDSPITTSVLTTFKYHLGSVSLGSFVLTIIALIRVILRSLTRNNKIKLVFACCVEQVDIFVRFLSKNAYIETAIHGQPFFRSGRRAAKLLMANAESMVTINSIGDFVLGVTQLFLIAISYGISYGMFLVDERSYWVVGLTVVLNAVAVIVIFGVFETTVDSLFICFCEDQVLNDGITKPFYMTKGLMVFVESSKKLYEEKK